MTEVEADLKRELQQVKVSYIYKSQSVVLSSAVLFGLSHGDLNKIVSCPSIAETHFKAVLMCN
jgi:hypothetical protein